MATKIFLQGRSGIGKSHMLRETLTPYAQVIAGFCVQRLIENGCVVGFRAVCLEGQIIPPETKYVHGLSGIFILNGQKNVAVLEEIILKVEEDSREPHCMLVLMDEIGGVELTSKVFMGALLRILAGNKPCCGVFKAWENFSHASSVLRLEEQYISLHKELELMLCECGELITVTEQNSVKVHSWLTKKICNEAIVNRKGEE